MSVLPARPPTQHQLPRNQNSLTRHQQCNQPFMERNKWHLHRHFTRHQQCNQPFMERQKRHLHRHFTRHQQCNKPFMKKKKRHLQRQFTRHRHYIQPFTKKKERLPNATSVDNSAITKRIAPLTKTPIQSTRKSQE